MGVDYVNTFITIADDCRAADGLAPPARPEKPTVASLTFQMIHENPYRYLSSDVIFTVMADRKGIPDADREQAREEFYLKGQACLRSSDLGKRYGWGVHADDAGRIALYAVGSPEYRAFVETRADPATGIPITLTRAMRSSRA